MPADILPALSSASGLDIKATAEAWEKARSPAMQQNRMRDDTRTFVLTLENFRSAHPFDYATLSQASRTLQTRKASNAPATQGAA